MPGFNQDEGKQQGHRDNDDTTAAAHNRRRKITSIARTSVAPIKHVVLDRMKGVPHQFRAIVKGNDLEHRAANRDH